MNKSVRFAVLIVVLSGMLVAPLTGCNPSQAASVKVVKIGVIYPLSGGSAATGQDLKQAVELAADIVNNQHDLNLPLAKTAGLPGLKGAKIELVYGDSQGTPEAGASEAERLIGGGVVALLGCYNSNVTASASQVAEGKGIPFLNPESTSATLTQRGYKWFFRTTADDTAFVKNFFDFMKEVEQRKGTRIEKVAIVYENSLFGTGVAQLETQAAKAAGMSVVADIPYSSKATSVQTETAKIKAAAPQVVLQSSYEDDAILYMQTYKAQNVRPQALLAMNAGFIGPKFIQTLGADAGYVLSRDVFSLDLGEKRPVTKQVNDLYRQRYGADMTGNSARAFTGLLVLAEAINRAGSTKPDAIREKLAATNLPADQLIVPWDGVKFDPTGQNTLAKGIIVQFQDGAYHTVWPWNVATRDLVWPMPAWK